MQVRFYDDPDTGLPHCYQHGVDEREAIDVLRRPANRLRRKDGTFVAFGQTVEGRYLQVVYRENIVDHHLFVITAYDMSPSNKKAFRRRHKHKRRP